MKKDYHKPMFTVDSFAMSQSIAKTCAGVLPGGGSTLGRPTNGDPITENCAFIVGGAVAYFVTNNTACTTPVKEDADIGGGCYNNPTGDMQAFGS